MRKVLGVSFFNRDTKQVAKELLGKYLVRKIGKKEVTAMIVETEAYDGPHDRASHARFGKTQRSAVLFADPGVWYVYLCYGIHEMLNIVTREQGYPGAVLIRAVLINGKSLNGPGKLTKYLQIDRRLNEQRATRKSGLWVEDRQVRIAKKHIKRTPRIGVDYAGPLWSKKHWRFVIEQGKE